MHMQYAVEGCWLRTRCSGLAHEIATDAHRSIYRKCWVEGYTVNFPTFDRQEMIYRSINLHPYYTSSMI